MSTAEGDVITPGGDSESQVSGAAAAVAPGPAHGPPLPHTHCSPIAGGAGGGAAVLRLLHLLLRAAARARRRERQEDRQAAELDKHEEAGLCMFA